MNTREKILHENKVQANKFAATMLLIITITGLASIFAYYIGFRAEIVNTAYGSYLPFFTVIGLSILVFTIIYIFNVKGVSSWVQYLVVFDLLMLAVFSSFLLRVGVNWSMFVLCVIYTIRYSNPSYTLKTGIVSSLAVLATHFSLIPYGFSTGYLNLNLVELSEDATIHIKKGSYGIYNAIIKDSKIDMSYVYREATIEILFPLIIFIAVVYICYRISKYNLAKIDEQARDEDRITAALNNANTANNAKTQFLSRMSHDIRTPMNAVIGYTELLSQCENPEDHERYINSIKISSNQLLNLLNNVLEMSRIESGKLELNEEETDLYSYVDEIGILIDAINQEKNISIIRNTDITKRFVFLDKNKCNEIFLNIISNSIKYTPAGGTIEVTIQNFESEIPNTTEIEVIIKDNGRGMSKEFLPHIFENFAREDTTNTGKVSGTGLGMSIVKQLVDLMNGDIKIESELGKGTTTTINIPLKIASKKEVVSSTTTHSENFSLQDKRVLLAEDNDFNAEIMIEILKLEGVTVDRAADGIECIEMLKKSTENYYDLILMDFQMPNLDGLEATKRIRVLDDKSKANIPIIAITANAFESDRKLAMEAGMDGFISKPIEIDILRKTMGEILANK